MSEAHFRMASDDMAGGAKRRVPIHLNLGGGLIWNRG